MWGWWAKNEDETDSAIQDPTVTKPMRIVPSVQDHKNALLLMVTEREYKPQTVATVQHAILRGIECVFQLEEGEMLAEPMPGRDTRCGFLLYEATEGGAGVLTRLVHEPQALANVALEALRIMHFGVSPLPDSPADLASTPETKCVAACYRCLMSYYNQPDHELIDRRDNDARELLLRLARSTTVIEKQKPVQRPSARPSVPPPSDPALAWWFVQPSSKELPQPDKEPMSVDGTKLALVWRDHYVVAVLGNLEESLAARLEDKGFEAIAFGDSEEARRDSFARLAAALGRAS